MHHCRLGNALGIVVIVTACMSAPGFGQSRPWEAEDTFRIKQVGDLHVSPDGSLLLFVLSEPNLEENRTYSSIWILPAPGGSPRHLTEREGASYSPRWSPDGSRIAFFAGDRAGTGLWIMNRDGSDKNKLTAFEQSNAYLGYGDNVGNSLAWSPDGQTLAYAAAGPRHYSNVPSPQIPPNENEPMVVDRILFKAGYYYSDLRRTYVWTIPAAGGRPTQISTGDFDYHSISWSPDGRAISCISNRTGRDDFDSNTDVCLLSPSGGQVRRLTRTEGPEYQPFWSPDGTRIAYQVRERKGRSKESDGELKKIFVMNSNGGDPVNLTAPLDRWSNPPSWSGDGKTLYFTAQNSGTQPLYSAPAAGGSITKVFEDKGTVGSFALSKDGDVFIAYSDDTHPSEIYRLGQGGKVRERLTSFNDSLLSMAELSKAEKFTYSSFDGLLIEGWLLRPHGFRPGTQYPMILVIHGGPHGQYGYNFFGKFQYYAGRGNVVVYINPRGSTGRGQQFSDGCVGDLGGADYRDLMTGVDHIIDRYGFVDPGRLAVTGTSYGGYMTNWIVTQTDRFKAAAPVSGISNLISMWGTGANFLWFPTDMGFLPMDNYERAWAVSPLKYIKNCRTPTMFISGAWDFYVPLYQAEEMFVALKMLGVEAIHVSYPNEGHGVRNQPRHTLDYHKRTADFFAKQFGVRY